jgi:hypothetical protein
VRLPLAGLFFQFGDFRFQGGAVELRLFLPVALQALSQLVELALQVVDAGALDLCRLRRLVGTGIESIPIRLPGVHGPLGLLQRFARSLRLLCCHLPRRIVVGELPRQLFESLGVDAYVRLDLVPRLLGLVQLLALCLAGFLVMLNGLLDACDLRAQGIETSLHFVEAFAQLDVLGAAYFQPGLDGAQLRGDRLQPGFLFLDSTPPVGAFLVQLLVAQGQQFGADAALLFAQLLETFRTARLAFQFFKLFLYFFS